MKKALKLAIPAILFAGVVASCEMFGDILDITFETNEYTIDFTVNPATAGDYTFAEEILQSDIQEQVEEYGGGAVSLQGISVSEAKLKILTEGITFDTFDRINVYIGTDDTENVLVGSATISAEGLTEISLNLTEEELKDIFDSEEYIVTVTGSLGEELTVAVDMLLVLKYNVAI
jgi:hypothetical protein